MGLTKTYWAKIVLGTLTTTDDVTGEPISTWSGSFPPQALVAQALDSFLGQTAQKPPAFSAIKLKGRVAHKAARAGKPLDLPPRSVRALDLKLLAYEAPEVILRLTVSSGYYVRSLARDLGLALGLGGGALKELRRERIGPFELKENMALPLDKEELSQRLLSPRQALVANPEVLVTQAEAEKLAQGQAIRPQSLSARQDEAIPSPIAQGVGSEPSPDAEGDSSLEFVKIIDPQGHLMALGQWEPRPERGQPPGPFLRPWRVLRSPLAIGNKTGWN
jgi:tRNA pseudouridine(55) synthase